MITLAFATSPALSRAQKSQQLSREPETVQKIFPIRYADPNDLQRVLQIFPNTMLIPNRDLGVLTVSAPAEIMPAIEAAIQRLDVPPPPRKTVVIYAYILTLAGGGPSKPLPPELEPVVRQLKQLFPNRKFRLMDTLLLRAREGSSADTRSAFPSELENETPLYQDLYIYRVQILEDQGNRLIRLEKMDYRVAADPGFKMILSSLATDLDLRAGQKIVVGKGTLKPGSNLFILVITAAVESPSGK